MHLPLVAAEESQTADAHACVLGEKPFYARPPEISRIIVK
jgi:hypothetical protein